MNGSASTPDVAAVHAALAKVAPSLVRIHVVSIEHEDGRELKREAAGSGTIITAGRARGDEPPRRGQDEGDRLHARVT